MSKSLNHQLSELASKDKEVLQEVCNLLWEIACSDADPEEAMDFFREKFNPPEDEEPDEGD